MKIIFLFIFLMNQTWAAVPLTSGTYYPAGDLTSNCLLGLEAASGQSIISATLVQNPKVPSRPCAPSITVIFQYDARSGRHYSQIVKESYRRYRYGGGDGSVIDFYYQYELSAVNEGNVSIAKNRCNKDGNNYLCKQPVSQQIWQKIAIE